MRISIVLPTYILVDNQYVLCNTYKPHSRLKKKSCYISFHFVCGWTAMDEWKTAYINIHSNHDDTFTNLLAGGEKKAEFIGCVLHYID